jgi:hypothetical protein
MIAADSTRTRWVPATEQDHSKVLLALEEVLSSPHFCNSKRYPAFLRYVVEQSLLGQADQLKERTIGVEVFGRTPTYDTNTDTVVRYTAGEVRKRLSLHYHEVGETAIQIHLSARSYQPEFLVLDEAEEASQAEIQIAVPEHAPNENLRSLLSGTPVRPGTGLRKRVLTWVVVTVLLALGGVAWMRLMARHKADSLHQFWAPVLQANGPVLISPGGVVFSQTSRIGTQVADHDVMNPFLSFENGLAMGRVAALVNGMGGSYTIQSSNATSLAQIRESPVVLIGAYNNDWTQRLLGPLRFHFSAHPGEQIVDGAQPGRHWVRDLDRPYSESPDYAIVARFRNLSTDSMVVVVAGLQRYGTDAASQFIISSRNLNMLTARLGPGWAERNLEIVLKVDVVNGRVGAPMIEDAYMF